MNPIELGYLREGSCFNYNQAGQAADRAASVSAYVVLISAAHTLEQTHGKSMLFTTVMSLSLHHAQAQDLYEEKRSHESLAEKTDDKSVKRARVRGRLARRRPLWLRWQVIPAHAPLRSL